MLGLSSHPHALARRWRVLITTLAITCLGTRVGHPQGVVSVDTVPPPRRIVAVPWDSTRAQWTGRLVVGEFVTGVFCVPCQQHEEAFNAFLRRYPATAFLSLAYHEEIDAPLGDPADSNQIHLYCWYGRGWPGVCPGRFNGTGFDDWIDGVSTPPAGMDAFTGQHIYGTVVPVIDAELRRPPEAFFRVQTAVQGGQVLARVHVDSVTGSHPQVVLRLLVVEDTVTLVSPHLEEHGTLPDSQGVSHPVVAPLRREYHMVVRAYAHLPGFAMGVPIQVPSTLQYTFDVAAIQRRHLGYHQVATLQAPAVLMQDSVRRYLHPYMNADWIADFTDYMRMFTDPRDWTINPLRLHVVAFVQDARTGAVLQTVMVPVDGQRLVLR